METEAPSHLTFTCAVASAQGPRDEMEDTHTIVIPFAGVHGQALFGIFDGHGGDEVAKWCNKHYPEVGTQCLSGLARHADALRDSAY